MTDLNLTDIRARMVYAERPTRQGSGAVWELDDKRDAAASVARQLLAEVERHRQDRDAMRAVVEAAKALCSHGPLGILGATGPEANVAWVMERDRRWAELRSALHALQEGDAR